MGICPDSGCPKRERAVEGEREGAGEAGRCGGGGGGVRKGCTARIAIKAVC